ncbi:M20 family metallopeptidase [Lentzea sp. NPDC004782]|uniref:M20 family metallopeptidase n=1 Tax=Lentzea sp. NPDC004782 TaxID=3154458 RepID=UPI0033B9DE9E
MTHDLTADIVADILSLVNHETSSHDLPGLAAGLDHLRDLATARLGPPDVQRRHRGDGCGDTATLTYTGTGPGHVALIGHYDTVWPPGTLADWAPPAAGRSPKLGGPGIFDMKTGLAQGIWALKLARDAGGPVPTVTFVFNGDEEIGSPSSRPIIEHTAAEADATLVLEPSADGAVKTARKGTGTFTVTATGIESHAGLAPEAGASAVHALAEFVTAASAVAAPDAGTTVNVGLINGGTGANVVAGRATATIDIRVRTQQEKDRVDAELKAIRTSDPRVRIVITHGWNRPPMTLNAASARLLDLARAVAQDQGHDLRDAAVGGASDANFVAALGLPVLCGLGAVGGGAHAREEFICPDTVQPRTALLAGLLTRLATWHRNPQST